MKYSLCNDWEFTTQWTEAFAHWQAPGEPVRLPHTNAIVPQHYADPADYEMVCGYRRKFRAPEGAERVFLIFDGAAHQAAVFVNGKLAGEHVGGYTGFRLDVTDLVDRAGENTLAVRLDTHEDPTVPPFGYVVDYLTYGGLYREVWLESRGERYISDLFVSTPDLHTAVVRWEGTGSRVRLQISAPDGYILADTITLDPCVTFPVPEAEAWGPGHTTLYTCRAAMLREDGQEEDVMETKFGFRTAQFRAGGFYLNGERYFLRGLNRHQS